MDYFDKISTLDEEDFFSLLSRLDLEPRWVTSAGKRVIQVLGACHHGSNHSAIFDPDTLKFTCFSLCGRGLLLHTFIKQAFDLTSPQEAKLFIEKWIESEDLDLSNRPIRERSFEYQERPFEPSVIDIIPAIPESALATLKTRFRDDLDTLRRLVWYKKDGITPEIMSLYDVMYYPDHGSIILPHHNKEGGIVGIYERSFKPLRNEIKQEFPETPKKDLAKYPRSKYMPLLKDQEYWTEEKRTWSFPNSKNLYGLHLAKEEIYNSGKAIIFEGGKSVMLARQYGFPYAVATHTFGCHLNHISMLLECGAKEIIFAFDKQYRTEEGREWDLYEHKTQSLAEKIKKYCSVSRIRDDSNLLGYKDAPIDRGQKIFEKLFEKRESLETLPLKSGFKIDLPVELEKQKEAQRAASEVELKKRKEVLSLLW